MNNFHRCALIVASFALVVDVGPEHVIDVPITAVMD